MRNTLFIVSLYLILSACGEKRNEVKFISEGNPIVTDKFTADPAPMVHNGRLYLYVGHDEAEEGQDFNITEWLCYSTKDMKTWTDHGCVLKPTDFSWGVGEAWASQVVEKDGKFYYYTTVQADAPYNSKVVGVAVSDSPTGPFIDARGTPLITDDMTPNGPRGWWNDIDPTVFIDDDGQAYLYWGNTQCYYVKLKKNMIELDGPIVPVHLPRYTEAPWIHKRGDWYYLSYASEFPEKICYAMSRSITGPWEYKGILNEIAGNSNTNHQAIIEFKGDWYFIYHNGSINTAGGSFRRSVCIDRLYYNEDGTMKRIQMTTEGVQ